MDRQERDEAIEFVLHTARENDVRFIRLWLTMADTVMTYRLVVKEIALRHGVYASFMPKPVGHLNGNGMLTNLSL